MSSLYNMVCGVHVSAKAMLQLLGLPHTDVPRFRDCYLLPDRRHIILLTRTGGNNRVDYTEENALLRRHPAYLDDCDDEFDSTFALFKFSVPESVHGTLDKLPDEFVEARDLKTRMDDAMARMTK